MRTLNLLNAVEPKLPRCYRREGGDAGPGELVESQPNVMPLNKDGNIYTLDLGSPHV